MKGLKRFEGQRCNQGPATSLCQGQLGKPKSLERALTHFIASWSEEQAMFFRKACGKLPMARGVVRDSGFWSYRKPSILDIFRYLIERIPPKGLGDVVSKPPSFASALVMPISNRSSTSASSPWLPRGKTSSSNPLRACALGRNNVEGPKRAHLHFRHKHPKTRA